MARRHKLIISYFLMGLLAIGAAVVLLGSTFGYSINTKTGQIVQNGLIFVSANTKAHIIINNADSGKLSNGGAVYPGPTRLVLPDGRYKLALSIGGYRPWSTAFRLSSQQLLRLNYPVLVPKTLNSKSLSALPAGSFISQTPDNRFLLALVPAKNGLSAKQYDMSNPTKAPINLTLPVGIAKFSGGVWNVNDWSSDSSSVLLAHSLGGRRELVVFSRTKPTSSYSLASSSLAQLSSQVSFRHGSTKQFYELSSSRILSLYDVSLRRSAPVASKVSTFGQLGPDRVFFATSADAAAGHILVKIWDGTSAYELTQLPAGKILVSADSFNGHDYYLASSSGGDKVEIFEDPLPAIKSGSPRPAISTLKLKSPQVFYITALADSQAVIARSGTSFTGYDFERQASFSYSIKLPKDAPARVLDGYHLTSLATDGTALMWDDDGHNFYQLSAANLSGGVYIDASGRYLFTLSGTNKKPQLWLTDLVKG